MDYHRIGVHANHHDVVVRPGPVFEQDALGIHEKMEGLHDDYYISSIIMVHDLNGVRLPERIKAGKATINGVSLTPAEKTIANGKKIVAFRTEATVKAIKKAIGS